MLLVGPLYSAGQPADAMRAAAPSGQARFPLPGSVARGAPRFGPPRFSAPHEHIQCTVDDNGMSDNAYAHDAGVANDLFGTRDCNPFRRVISLRENDATREPVEASPAAVSPGAPTDLFRTVRANIVQSIRAFRVPELADEAQRLDQHFLYANCSAAQTKGEVMETIATSFLFPRQFAKTYDALYSCMTEQVQRCGPQPGFVVVLEHLPVAHKFDKEARETLLDVFREAAEFWGERQVPFRVFYSFA
jgi:RNAse (barnase) inhibitor barstar